MTGLRPALCASAQPSVTRRLEAPLVSSQLLGNKGVGEWGRRRSIVREGRRENSFSTARFREKGTGGIIVEGKETGAEKDPQIK